MQNLIRTLTLDAGRADKKRRMVPAVLSSEFPVPRAGYDEVLLHGPENVDTSRAPLPLIESHDGTRLNIGLVDNLRVSGGKLRGDIVFGSSTRADELWPDVEAGIVRNLSIGYEITEYRENGTTLEATRWRPYEASLVSIPADPTAGTYRSFDSMSEMNESQPAAEAGERLSRSERRALKSTQPGAEVAVAIERQRVAEIEAFANTMKRYAPGIEQLAREAVHDGESIEAFGERARVYYLGVMDHTASTRAPLSPWFPEAARRQMAAQSGGKPGLAARQFSIVRALAGAIDPRGVDNGFERECSEELTRQLGRKPKGIYVPMGRLSERDFTVSGASAMVGTQHLGSEFIDVLRARSFVMQIGTRILSGLTQNVSIPRLTASATAGWIAGDGADGFTASAQSADSVTLSPKCVGALTVLSRKMVLQGDPDAETLVRNDLAQLIGTQLDLAAIKGTGASNQPTGVVNTSNINTGTFPLAGPDFASVVAIEGALGAKSADLGSLAYLTAPALAASLKSTQKAATSSEFIWTSSGQGGVGSMNGYPSYATGNMVADKILFGNWNDLLLGIWGGLDLEVDPYYDFSKGSIAVRIMAYADIAVRHPESFALWSRAEE